jgi:atypical dual specificity phosphatase
MSLHIDRFSNTYPLLPGLDVPLKDHEIKVASVFKRVVHSPLFWCACAFVAAVVFTIVAVAVPPLGIPIIAIAIIAGVALLGVSATAIALRKKIVFDFSFVYNCIRHKYNPDKWTKYDQILDNLYLGRIPIKNENDHVHLPKDVEIGAVLSMVERFENHSLGLLSDPVTPEDWKSLGIEHHQIEAQDFHPLTVDEIEEGVAFIEENIGKGLKVYVHCKAGRSRSATIVAAYLVKSGACETLDDAFSFMKQRRPAVKVGQKKIDVIKDYLKTHSL